MKRYFYQLLQQYYSFYILPDSKVITLDVGDTSLLPILGSNPDYIILNGNIHSVTDVQLLLENVHAVSLKTTRVIISYYSSLWKPLLGLADRLGLRKKQAEINWVSPSDIKNFLRLSNFELVSSSQRILIPIYIPILSNFINRWLAPLPFFRWFAMVNIAIVKPVYELDSKSPSVSVVVAARNEAGNIESLFARLPKMGSETELIIIEGGSSDGTWDEIQKVKNKYAGQVECIVAKQKGKGKGDAVRMGFSLATKEILMILDADLTVAPEDLPKFYHAIVQGKGDFINGSRLVYPMEGQAMRFFNMIGNKFFAMAFSFLLGQGFKDTLCGTKVLTRERYEKLAANRKFFGDFDPFGDFDLIFGASRLGLKIIELPIRYKDRTYGETNISRWKHGLILLRMVIFAARRIKFI